MVTPAGDIWSGRVKSRVELPAESGPPLVTSMVKLFVVFTSTCVGPAMVTPRSAGPLTVTVAEAVLFDGFLSG